MKNIFIGNSAAWLRLSVAILAVAFASLLAKGSIKGGINLSPKPGSMQEW
jgi:hypothetical protein